MFSEAVCAKIGNYVYRLIDPRNGETFYVGKGRNNRVFQHIAEQIADDTEDGSAPKLERIRAIYRAGLEVIHIIHRHEIPDGAIDHVEAALIDTYAGLTNIQGGYNSGSIGPMHAEEIIQRYDLPDLDFKPEHKLLLLNINASFDETGDTDYYEETRTAWRVSMNKTKEIDYVIAVVRGVTKQVFIADQWLPATLDNFPKYRGEPDSRRYGFVGHVAPDNILDMYVGKRGKRIINPDMKHGQNPIKYYNI